MFEHFVCVCKTIKYKNETLACSFLRKTANNSTNRMYLFSTERLIFCKYFTIYYTAFFIHLMKYSAFLSSINAKYLSNLFVRIDVFIQFLSSILKLFVQKELPNHSLSGIRTGSNNCVRLNFEE